MQYHVLIAQQENIHHILVLLHALNAQQEHILH